MPRDNSVDDVARHRETDKKEAAWRDGHTTQAAGLAYALYPADKNASIPMGFQYEKEAVGEVPQMAEESAPAIKGARD